MQRRPRRVREGEPPPPPNFNRQAYELLCRVTSPLVPIAVQDTDAIVLLRPEEVAFVTPLPDKKVKIVDRAGREWVKSRDFVGMWKLLKDDARFEKTHESFIANLYLVRKVVIRGPKDWLLYFDGLPATGDRSVDVSGENIPKIRGRLGL